MQKSITTCLTFSKNAEEAIRFYVAIFNQAFGSSKGESKILKITHFGEDELKDLLNVPDVPKDMMPGPAGSVKTIRFLLNGQEFIAINGGGYFGKFHESMSLYVCCDNQQQIDTLYDALAVNGELQPCGWVKDRFGISWQITPNFLWDMDEDDDKIRSQKVMKALYGMNKVDIERIKEVWNS
jgi:predicted 3-demethylubiquinone-9 3-methyltransferase (glyoxalase superfamily)